VKWIWRLVVAFVTLVTYNWLTILGSTLATISAGMIIALMGLATLGFVESLYLGLVTFLILPGFFVSGLLIIPAGVVWEYRRRRAQLGGISGEAAALYPVVDFGKHRVRDVAATVALLTVVNFLIIGTVSYKGVVFTDSPEFCGVLCHEVMEPEFTAYVDSPHSRVACVECHIGPGVPWYVRSKLSGVPQVYATLMNTYPRPIPTPVHSLRPSKETCEECHWPEKFSGNRLRVIKEYQEDETNTLLYTVLVMHIGGGNAGGHGIHSWHIDPNKKTTYLASDEARQQIEVVRVTDASDQVTEYRAQDAPQVSGEQLQFPNAEFRTMDCIDCHNRPTHIFQSPAKAVDQKLAQGLIDKTLPYIKKVGVEALNSVSGEAGDLEQIADHVRTYYQEAHPEILVEKKDAVEKAVEELQKIYNRNVFPNLKVTWNTYPNNIGHIQFTGCFRCHDDSHTSADGKVISGDCTLCHGVLAMQEEEPAILETLALE